METELIRQLKAYHPYNEQEEQDRNLIISCLENDDRIFLREDGLAHMTASGWVVNRDRTKVLMAYHNIYQSWAWLGGHADGETDLLKTALREVREESGLKEVDPVTDDIYSVEVLTVDGHRKNGRYVSSHLHLNITYLLMADGDAPLKMKKDENSGVAWFTPEEAVSVSSEPWYREHIYRKLNEKLKMIR